MTKVDRPSMGFSKSNLGLPVGFNLPMGPNVNLNSNFSPLAVNLPLAPGSAGNGGAGAMAAPAPLTQIHNAQSPFASFVYPTPPPGYAFAVTEPMGTPWWVPLAFLAGGAAIFLIGAEVLGRKDY